MHKTSRRVYEISNLVKLTNRVITIVLKRRGVLILNEMFRNMSETTADVP